MYLPIGITYRLNTVQTEFTQYYIWRKLKYLTIKITNKFKIGANTTLNNNIYVININIIFTLIITITLI